MSPTQAWWQKEGVDFAKVTYRTKDGYVTQAYIDLNTGLGDSKHSGIPVKVEWSDEENIWLQVDDWEWKWDEFQGMWIPVPPPGWQPTVPPPFVRTQPKRMTRRQRRSGKTNGQNAR